MSSNQILVPESSNDDNSVVAQLVEESRDLGSSVQVSLAKRVVRADGSNKVMCMAASHDLPLCDDEVASTSDLALKLSDGTNVKLSLSFFNDNAPFVGFAGGGSGRAADYIPFTRSFYDPDRYSVHTVKPESKLAPVLIGTVVVAMAGFYLAVGLPINSNLQSMQSTLATMKSIIANASKPGAVANHAVPSPKSLIAHHPITTPDFVPVSAPPAFVSASGLRSTDNAKPSRHHRHGAKAAQTSSNPAHQSRRDMFAPPPPMFVPPPPPTPYTLPSGVPLPFDQIESLNPSAKPAKAKSKAATADAKRPANTELKTRPDSKATAHDATAHDAPIKASAPKLDPKAVAAQALMSMPRFEPAYAQTVTRSAPQREFVKPKNVEQPVQTLNNASFSEPSNAPLPGADSGQIDRLP